MAEEQEAEKIAVAEAEQAYEGIAVPEEERSDEEIALAEESEERGESYGDKLIEEFSAESNVSRIAGLLKIPAGVVNYIVALIYLVVGVLCVALTEQVTNVLPYIVGAMMILLGMCQFIYALIHREYRSLKTNQTATSLIIVALGVMIILEHLDPESTWAITFISIVWGILGLLEGAHAFNHAFKRIAHSERCVFYLMKGIVECVVAFMLLYQPNDHDIHHFHIIVFGVNLIFDSITMIPKVKTFLSMV